MLTQASPTLCTGSLSAILISLIRIIGASYPWGSIIIAACAYKALKLKEREEIKYEARVRRMISGSKRKESSVPEAIHKLWAKGKKARRELAKILIECAGDKDHDAASQFFPKHACMCLY